MLHFNLPSIMRRTRPGLARRGGTITLPEVVIPKSMATRLEREYMRVVRAWWEGARDHVIPAYQIALEREADRKRRTVDSLVITDVEGVSAVIEAIQTEVNRIAIELTIEGLADWVASMEKVHRERWLRSLIPSGVTLQTEIMGPDDVAGTMDATVEQNVSLVRNLSASIKRRIEQIVFQGFQQRKTAPTVAKELSEAVGIERRRARFIASDQTQKLSAQLDTERMEQVGITKFEWRHSGKVHYRPHHKARHGEVFKLRGDIDPDDMPGIPPWCGCKKRAVVTLAE